MISGISFYMIYNLYDQFYQVRNKVKRKVFDPKRNGARRIKEPPPKKKYKQRVVEIGAYIDRQLYLGMAVRITKS